ncbi:MAG: GldG family protein [Terricaulis sp.]
MNGRRYALAAAFSLLLIFIGANVIANSWFRSWRLDLTENRLYTLSGGARGVLNELSEPVELKLYFSRAAAAPFPQAQAYAARVREMLQTFAAHSSGRVRFVEVNVERFSVEEDEAQEGGIEAQPVAQGADPIYFGVVGANSIDDRRVIPSLSEAQEPFLEYQVTRLIYQLQNPDRPQIALITALPLDPAAAADPTFPSGQSWFATELGRSNDVVKLPVNFETIPDADVLAIIHPWALSPQQMYAVDQFILRKGRAFIALDPAARLAQQQAGAFDPANPMGVSTSSSLAPLLGRWGIEMAATVVLDGENALPIQVQLPNGQVGEAPQPLFFAVPAGALDREDMMTAGFSRGFYLGMAGGLNVTEQPGITVTRLAQTSGRTMRIPADMALSMPSPYDIASIWQGSAGRRELVALRLSGNLETAFADGAPPAAVAQEGAAPQPQTGVHLVRSTNPAQVVVVSDVDFLGDDFYIGRDGAPQVDNGFFALNAIDILSGSDDLVSLRSRAPSARPMKVLENLERDAQQAIEARQRELQADLQSAQSRLVNLQQRGRGSGFFSGNLGAELTPEENAEMKRVQQELIDARTALRGVEREHRKDVDGLQALVMFINMWLAPLLVAAGGLYFFWRRQRRVGARR